MTALIAIPNRDFDPTEAAVPWDRLRNAGIRVQFATCDGTPGACDPRLLTGVIFGRLGATPENVALYRQMAQSPEFNAPVRYRDVSPATHSILILPGGHAKGVRQYLESKELQAAALAFLRAGSPVAAICHGCLVLARTIDPTTGRSVIHGRRMTALTKLFERTAWLLTAWRLGDYYRTYPSYVEDEVVAAIGDPSMFERGPPIATYKLPFVVEDGSLLTARWQGDASLFATRLVELARRTATLPEAPAPPAST